MDNINNEFGIIAKLSDNSSESLTITEKIYEELFAEVVKNIYPAINKSPYIGKSKLKNEIELILKQIQLFVVHPYLYSKSIIGVFAGSSDFSDNILNRLQILNVGSIYVKQRGLPYVLFDSDFESNIYLKIKSGKLIKVNFSEYIAACKLFKQNIMLNDLARSIFFPIKLKYKNSNYVIFPKFAKKKSLEYKYLADLCDIYLYLFDGTYDYKELPYENISANKKIVIVANNTNDAVESCLNFIKSKCPSNSVMIVEIDHLEKYLESYDRMRKNFYFYDSILEKLLQLKSVLTLMYDKHEANIKGLANDSIFSTESMNEIIKLRNNEVYSKNNIEKILDDIRKSNLNIMELINKIKQEIINSFSSDKKDRLSEANIKDVSEVYNNICSNIVNYALLCKDYSLAKKYILKLQVNGYKFSYILNLYYELLSENKLVKSDIDKLINEKSDDQLVLHAKIKFYREIKLSDTERNKLASKILDKNADEMYYYACYVEETNGERQAFFLYQSAVDLGSTNAGDRLVSYYMKNSNINYFELKKLADKFIPRAAFYYGKYCLENRKYAQGITYLRISVSLLYTPAIIFYAEYLYNNIHQDFKKSEVLTAIYLYKVIADISSDRTIFCKLGILHHMVQDYISANKYFGLDCSLPEAKFRLGKMYFYGNCVTQDDINAKRYLEEALKGGCNDAEVYLSKLKNKQERQKNINRQNRYNKYSSNMDYQPKYTRVSSRQEGCFITTATCLASGKGDDCAELTAFRRYRDEVLLNSKEGDLLVKVYYKIAPKIVDMIANDENYEEIYQYLYNNYIKKGYELLLAGKGDEAKNLYMEGVLMLARKYGVDIPISEGYKYILDDGVISNKK